MPSNAEERRSAGGVPFLPLGPGVTPNAAKDVQWRQQAGWGYSGIQAAGESSAAAVTFLTVNKRERQRWRPRTIKRS